MPSSAVHPVTRVIVWLLFLFAVQCLNGAVLAVVFLLLPLLGSAILKRGGHLVWRTRWLLLSLLVIFSWGVAGEPLWTGAAAPTHEGFIEALTHLGRLLLVLMAVAAFLETMPLPDLLAATHTLLKPLQRLGLDPERGVVRLMLVLRYAETLPRPRDWRSLLDAPVASVNERFEVNYRRLRWTDYAIVLIISVAATFFCFR